MAIKFNNNDTLTNVLNYSDKDVKNEDVKLVQYLENDGNKSATGYVWAKPYTYSILILSDSGNPWDHIESATWTRSERKEPSGVMSDDLLPVSKNDLTMYHSENFNVKITLDDGYCYSDTYTISDASYNSYKIYDDLITDVSSSQTKIIYTHLCKHRVKIIKPNNDPINHKGHINRVWLSKDINGYLTLGDETFINSGETIYAFVELSDNGYDTIPRDWTRIGSVWSRIYRIGEYTASFNNDEEKVFDNLALGTKKITIYLNLTNVTCNTNDRTFEVYWGDKINTIASSDNEKVTYNFTGGDYNTIVPSNIVCSLLNDTAYLYYTNLTYTIYSDQTLNYNISINVSSTENNKEVTIRGIDTNMVKFYVANRITPEDEESFEDLLYKEKTYKAGESFYIVLKVNTYAYEILSNLWLQTELGLFDRISNYDGVDTSGDITNWWRYTYFYKYIDGGLSNENARTWTNIYNINITANQTKGQQWIKIEWLRQSSTFLTLTNTSPYTITQVLLTCSSVTESIDNFYPSQTLYVQIATSPLTDRELETKQMIAILLFGDKFPSKIKDNFYSAPGGTATTPYWYDYGGSWPTPAYSCNVNEYLNKQSDGSVWWTTNVYNTTW